MSVTYGFYDSLNGDRKYNAKQISELFDGLIRDGVFMSIGDALAVSAGGGMSITVGTGRAWFNHTWTYNDAPLILQVDQSEIALNRVDTVVLEVNSNIDVRANTIKIVKGVPSSEPVATELVRNEFVNQYPLAYIYVSAGATEITSANIENTRGSSDCPFVTGILELEEDTVGNLLNLIEAHKAETATDGVHGLGWLEALGTYKIPGNTVIISRSKEITVEGYGSASAYGGYYRALVFLAPYTGRYRLRGEARTTDTSYTADVLLAVAGAEAMAQYYGPNYIQATPEFTTSSTGYVSFSLDMDFPVLRMTPLIVMLNKKRYTTAFRNFRLCAIDGEPEPIPAIIYPRGL